MHSLAPFPRAVLRWDSRLSLLISAVGLVAAPLEAGLTGLPVVLIRVAAIALLPSAVVGVVASQRPHVPRVVLLGLAGFNGAWALSTALLARALSPTLVGVLLLTANVLVPATVGAVLAKALRAPELVRP